MKIRLFTPGPTPVPDEILREGASEMIHHRSPEFEAILSSVCKSLSVFNDADGATLLLTSSGTGAMEACVSSLFQEGDEVVVVEGGKFGERFVELARHYNLETKVVAVEWGKSVAPNAIQEVLSPNTKGVFVQACETSTGAYHPIAEIGNILRNREDILLVVDGITAMGVHDLQVQRDRIDAYIGGSQKAFMCPPGLAMISLSKRALKRASSLRSRSFYFSLQRELKAMEKNSTAFTPAISLVRQLNKAMQKIENEGRENVFRRHAFFQNVARKSLRAMGLELFNSDEDASFGITVVRAHPDLNVKAWLSALKREHGLWLAGGQGELEGKIFRLAHMGASASVDILAAIEVIEETLSHLYPNAKKRLGSKRAAEMIEKVAL